MPSHTVSPFICIFVHFQLTNSLQKQLNELRKEKSLLQQQINRERKSNSTLESHLSELKESDATPTMSITMATMSEVLEEQGEEDDQDQESELEEKGLLESLEYGECTSKI